MFRFLLFMFISLMGFTVPLPTGPVPVDIGLFVHDVGDLDALQEIVEIEATVSMAWPEKNMLRNNTPAKDAFYDVAIDPVLSEVWMPYLYIKNGRGPRTVIQRALFYDENGRWMYQERFKVLVETSMNVRLFPFDKQNLHIEFVPFGIPSTGINFLKNPAWEGVYTNERESEWEIKGHTSQVFSTSEGPHAEQEVYTVNIDYVRNPGFYVYKIIIPMLMLVILAMMSLLMKGDPISNRSQIALTCILSIIALQLVVYQSIPKVSYAIYIDVLFTTSFLTTCIILLRVALFNSILFLRRMRKLRTCIDIAIPIGFVASILIATHTFFS